ncbi:hypothetical protein B0H10DRAFT_2297310 [Mycena sp. CBHHK59/15]|nr:hypothetical protein B0H10DRAFT_2297310 [Mycena sp. CBHHK59/15]
MCIGFFVVGSTSARAAQNMPMMIAARAVQGISGGGIITLEEILTSGFVPLAERGVYQGVIGLTWSLCTSIIYNKTWRWLFVPNIENFTSYLTYSILILVLNLPFAGIAFILVVLFLQVHQPEGSIRSKLAQVDWIGNAIVEVGAGLSVIGLVWGGVRYSWASVQVLAPLIIGLTLIVVFAIYEVKVPSRSAIPSDTLKTRTGVSACVRLYFFVALVYYLPGTYILRSPSAVSSWPCPFPPSPSSAAR